MGLRVLAVDFDPDIVRLVAIKLRRAGFEVQTALTGDQGLTAALSWRPDVLLTEVMMPGLDGRTIVAETKRRLGELAPVAILLSQQGEESDIAAGLASGADDFIVKPFSPRELLERITVALVKSGRHSNSSLPDAALAEGSA